VKGAGTLKGKGLGGSSGGRKGIGLRKPAASMSSMALCPRHSDLLLMISKSLLKTSAALVTPSHKQDVDVDAASFSSAFLPATRQHANTPTRQHVESWTASSTVGPWGLKDRKPAFLRHRSTSSSYSIGCLTLADAERSEFPSSYLRTMTPLSTEYPSTITGIHCVTLDSCEAPRIPQKFLFRALKLQFISSFISFLYIIVSYVSIDIWPLFS
jgi:hypothetical protein